MIKWRRRCWSSLILREFRTLITSIIRCALELVRCNLNQTSSDSNHLKFYQLAWLTWPTFPHYPCMCCDVWFQGSMTSDFGESFTSCLSTAKSWKDCAPGVVLLHPRVEDVVELLLGSWSSYLLLESVGWYCRLQNFCRRPSLTRKLANRMVAIAESLWFILTYNKVYW